MIFNKKPIYKRILIKLSGEALQKIKECWVDFNRVTNIAEEIKELVSLNIQVAIVIGGGNLFRGLELTNIGITRIVSDYVGMLATVINGLIMRDALERSYVKTHLVSAIPINGIFNNYDWVKTIKFLDNNYVVIFTAGTGNPFFTTDSAACLRGIEIKADIVLKATKVDGIFSKDPDKYPLSKMYDRLSYEEVLQKELKIMDLSAFVLARDHDLPIHVFNINKPGALRRVIMGDKEGTLISK